MGLAYIGQAHETIGQFALAWLCPRAFRGPVELGLLALNSVVFLQENVLKNFILFFQTRPRYVGKRSIQALMQKAYEQYLNNWPLQLRFLDYPQIGLASNCIPCTLTL